MTVNFYDNGKTGDKRLQIVSGLEPPELAWDLAINYMIPLMVLPLAVVGLPFIFIMGFLELAGMPFPVVLNPAFVSWLGG